MQREVNVDQVHIEDGQPRKPQSCPIALALKAEFAGKGRVVVEIIGMQSFIKFYEPDVDTPDGKLMTGGHTFSNSPEVVDWIYAFDDDQEVKPITLILDESEGVMRLPHEDYDREKLRYIQEEEWKLDPIPSNL